MIDERDVPWSADSKIAAVVAALATSVFFLILIVG